MTDQERIADLEEQVEYHKQAAADANARADRAFDLYEALAKIVEHQTNNSAAQSLPGLTHSIPLPYTQPQPAVIQTGNGTWVDQHSHTPSNPLSWSTASNHNHFYQGGNSSSANASYSVTDHTHAVDVTLAKNDIDHLLGFITASAGDTAVLSETVTIT